MSFKDYRGKLLYRPDALPVIWPSLLKLWYSSKASFKLSFFIISGNSSLIYVYEIMTGVFRDPLPLSVVHIPLCVTFAFFDGGKFMLVDPTQREQMVADGTVVVSMNKHREICMLETSGCVLLTHEQVRSSAVFIVLCEVVPRTVIWRTVFFVIQNSYTLGIYAAVSFQ